ncbi:MAG TPA: branched-chain amino acid ABC transporter permease [Candidatus Binatia bacterium]|nr:branched-chain amino acid ABC transporter permease [Candidatus Binatia bacterium]
MYVLTVATLVGIYMILTLGLNTITGLAGQISLGHAAFFGVGAYTLALLTVTGGWPFWPALAAAVVAAGAFGALIGALAIRVRADFLAIATMGVNFVTVSVFLYVPLFGGALGIGGIPGPSLGGVEFGKPSFFGLTAAAVALALGLNLWLGRSWAGLAWLAIRDDEDAAGASAVDVRKFKILAFTLGTALAGLAGGLYASYLTFISASDFGFPMSITLLCMLVLGGIGTNRGALVGAAILGTAPEVFRFLADYRFLTYGGLLVLLMRFSPAGLLGDESRLWQWACRRLGRSGAPAAA